MGLETAAQCAAKAAIKAMQEQEGLSQAEVARRTGASPATVSRLVNGESTPRSYGTFLSAPALQKYVPGELLNELEPSKLPRDRVGELEHRVAALEATLAKLTGG